MHIMSKHTKVRAQIKLKISYFVSNFFIENVRADVLVGSTWDVCNFYSVNFLNHRFHTIGKNL